MESLNNPHTLIVAVPAFLLGINEFLKKIGMPSKFAPVVNLVGGIAFGVPLLLDIGFETFYAVIIGLMIGLSAGGFYDLGDQGIKIIKKQ